MNKLLPFVVLFVFMGQGCFSPAPASPEIPAPLKEGVMERGDEMGVVEGAASLEEGVAVFDIVAKDFSYRPNKITVNKGQKMRVRLTSEEGFYDWVVDAFDAHTMRINRGEEAMIEFTPDEAGTFEFYSSVGSHRANGMVGTLEVLEVDPVMIEVETKP